MTNKKELLFSDLGLSEEILKAIEEKGFTTPSPIQAGVIPLLLNGDKDIIGQSQTGTGKTAAFSLPLLERLDSSKKEIQAIILTPTRELAIQVGKEIASFSVENSPTITTVYGGNHIRKEIQALKLSPTIVVGTPGRIHHHIRNGDLDLSNAKYFVLDEADEMLNFGFREEIEEILSKTPEKRKVLLFSATMPQAILNIVNNYMKEYDTVKVESKAVTNNNILQKYYSVKDVDKFEALTQIIEVEERFYSIVFCRTKSEVDIVTSKLISKNIKAVAIHGDIDQAKREKILNRFKDGQVEILVATDVAARGIDVPDLNFVVNYTIPETYEAYTHRIGRTGRAGKAGTAITLVKGSEIGKIKYFEKNLNTKMEKGILPNPEELVAKKKINLIKRIEHIMDTKNTEHALDIAELLLEEGNPVEVVAALIQDTYRNDFNPSVYKTITEDPERSSGGNGSRRSGGYRGGRGSGNRGGGYRGRRSSGGNGGNRSGGGNFRRSGGSKYGSKLSGNRK